jgi:hypothetical protein
VSSTGVSSGAQLPPPAPLDEADVVTAAPPVPEGIVVEPPHPTKRPAIDAATSSVGDRINVRLLGSTVGVDSVRTLATNVPQ